MSHSHSHTHGGVDGSYSADQLFTVLGCGGIGLVAILMYRSGILERMLVPMFFVPVLVAGVAVLALVGIRVVAVWRQSGVWKPKHEAMGSHLQFNGESGNEHSHGADCNHGYGQSINDKDDEVHDHRWAPWRYVVLAIPVFMYFLGFPHDGISAKPDATPVSFELSPNRAGLAMFAGGPALTKALRKTEPRRLQLRFKELTQAAAFPYRHDLYEGDIGIIRGQFVPSPWSDREFTLLRIDRTCCYADEIQLLARIEAPDPIQGIKPEEWIRVEGLISFRKNARGQWMAVITLESNDAITGKVEPTRDANAH